MKRIALAAAAVAVLGLTSGCIYAPFGYGYGYGYGYRAYPAYRPAPVVVYPGYGYY